MLFISSLKLFSYSRYLSFCHKFLVMQEKRDAGSFLIRKIRLTSKFMTLQPGLQTIAIHIFPNISQSKGNLTMKFGQLIEYNKRNVFIKNYAENETGRLVPGLFLFF